MGFKKHDWMQYGKGNEIIEIIIKGVMGGKIDFFRCNNNEDFCKILRILKEKYGFGFGLGIEKKKEKITETP